MNDQVLKVLGHRVNHCGRVIANERSLLEELHASRHSLEAALHSLEDAGLVEVLSPLPFLVLRFHSWSAGSRDLVPEKQRISSTNRPPYIKGPVSSIAAAAMQEDGGVGEGDGLLDEVLVVLGPEADRDEFRRLLAGHHPALVHRCLKRVRATKHIRVSKPALFRSLLDRFSHS